MFSFSGMVYMSWTSADIPSALDQIRQANITLYDVLPMSELTVKFSVAYGDLKELVKISNQRGDRLEIQSRKGMVWYLRNLIHRPILVIGTVFLLILALSLPGRVFFYSVE